MRTVIGWMAAMAASALLGAAVYQTVLSKPSPQLDPTATVETISGDPRPGPTLYRTEVRTIVEPTPTVTIEDEVLVEDDVVQVSQPRPANPAPARTSAPRPTPRASDERETEDSTERDDDEKSAEDSDDAAEEAEDEAHDAAEKSAGEADESDD